mmetsp:Transcript_35187/g.86508  ORF Transcript_35187/g.86508 Transcript_35187/m.86508 type:complete len:183 (+) Transcript_35187:307-855(+)
MAKFPHVDFKVTWRPFFLDPTMPEDGRDKKEWYTLKFGEARMQQVLPRMIQVFDNVGLKYSLGGKTGSTMNSHRLIQWAGTVDLKKQDALVEELFKNYFTEEKFLNDRDVLLHAVKVAGLDEAEGARIIDDPSLWRKEVEDDIKKHARGVSGVPNFTFQNKLKISGGQPPEVFEEVIEEIVG